MKCPALALAVAFALGSSVDVRSQTSDPSSIPVRSRFWVGPQLGFTVGVQVPEGFRAEGTPTRLVLGGQAMYRLGEGLFLRAGLGARIEQASFTWAPEQLVTPWARAAMIDVVEPSPGSVRSVRSDVTTVAVEMTPSFVVRVLPFAERSRHDGLYFSIGALVDRVFGFSETQDWTSVAERPIDAPPTYRLSYDGTTGLGATFGASACFTIDETMFTTDVTYVTRSEGTSPDNGYVWLPGRGLRFGLSLMFPL